MNKEFRPEASANIWSSMLMERAGGVVRGPRGEEARVLGEEARRRLSGQGFSTKGREERRMSRSGFGSLGQIRVLTNPLPEPRRG
jgi:hypothetical protein